MRQITWLLSGGERIFDFSGYFAVLQPNQVGVIPSL